MNRKMMLLQNLAEAGKCQTREYRTLATDIAKTVFPMVQRLVDLGVLVGDGYDNGYPAECCLHDGKIEICYDYDFDWEDGLEALDDEDHEI